MQGILALLLASFIGGAISPVFIKFGVTELPPILFTGLRFLVATIFFAPFFLIHRHSLSLHDIRKLAVLSSFFIVNVVLFSFAIERTTVVMSQIMYAFVPVFVAILSVIILKEKISRFQISGGIVALTGLLTLLAFSFDSANALTFGTALGNIICLCAVICWSLYLIYSKKITKTYSPVVTSFFNFFSSMMVILLLSLTEVGQPANFNQLSVISVLVSGVISSALMIFLVQYGIKKTSALTAALFSYTGPLFAGVSGHLVFNEQIRLNLIIGGLLIVCGVFYATTLPMILNRKKSKD